jgi:hypothetical protein
MSLIATSKNAVITFSSVITGVKLLTGFSNENILVIPDVDIVKTTMGCDGLLNRALVAKKVEGNFSFFPGSPALDFIYTVQQAVYLSGVPVVGNLNVVFPSLGKLFNFLDFSFESAAKGLEAADELKPVTIKWSSQLPNYSSIGAIATTALGLL